VLCSRIASLIGSASSGSKWSTRSSKAAKTGELELEQAYLDFLIDRRFNIRAGAPCPGRHHQRAPRTTDLLASSGLRGHIHHPTTWFDAGAGVFGEFGRGWRYRATRWRRSTRRSSAPAKAWPTRPRALARSCATGRVPGRLEYLGVPRLTLGTSIWRGRTKRLATLDPRVTLVEADGRGRLGRLELRGEIARVRRPADGSIACAFTKHQTQYRQQMFGVSRPRIRSAHSLTSRSSGVRPL
jgi:hypothetical protein